jgi:hypothetical protein
VEAAFDFGSRPRLSADQAHRLALSLDALQTSAGSALAAKLRDMQAPRLISVSTAELECLLATLVAVDRKRDEGFAILRREAVREFLDRPHG